MKGKEGGAGVVTAYSKVLPRNLPGGTEENPEDISRILGLLGEIRSAHLHNSSRGLVL
jgi:hypothetical protein